MRDSVMVDLRLKGHYGLDDVLPVMSRLGVGRMNLDVSMAHPICGVRRLSEVGAKIRDAGIAVETYITHHVLGENSPDALACKIDAAKAVGARAFCLSIPSDGNIERSRETGPRRSAEYCNLEKYVLSDWEKARRDLRAVGLGIRLSWVSGVYGRSGNYLQQLLALDGGDDVGVSWRSYNDADYMDENFPLLRAFGKRICDFSFSFDGNGRWFPHGYTPYRHYPEYTLEQKKEKCIEDFCKRWHSTLDYFFFFFFFSVEFRIGYVEGEDEAFLVSQLDALADELKKSERRKKASTKGERRSGK